MVSAFRGRRRSAADWSQIGVTEPESVLLSGSCRLKYLRSSSRLLYRRLQLGGWRRGFPQPIGFRSVGESRRFGWTASGPVMPRCFLRTEATLASRPRRERSVPHGIWGYASRKGGSYHPGRKCWLLRAVGRGCHRLVQSIRQCSASAILRSGTLCLSAG